MTSIAADVAASDLIVEGTDLAREMVGMAVYEITMDAYSTVRWVGRGTRVGKSERSE
jgi:hypothetical protein